MLLPGESQGRGSLVGCHLWGPTESEMTKVTQQQQQHCLFQSRFVCVCVCGDGWGKKVPSFITLSEEEAGEQKRIDLRVSWAAR